MNRQKFLAELSQLLGFMSSWDRQDEMNKYTEMLDAAEDEQALLESLGTPTQIAIAIALDYKPTPKPGTEAPPPPEPEAGPEQTVEAADSGAEPEAEPEPEPEPPPPPKKRDEMQIVTDGEFEYGMELAILMGEPISAAVESALNGEYLPDPDFALDDILRENGVEPGPPPAGDEGEGAEVTGSEAAESLPVIEEDEDAAVDAEAYENAQEAAGADDGAEAPFEQEQEPEQGADAQAPGSEPAEYPAESGQGQEAEAEPAADEPESAEARRSPSDGAPEGEAGHETEDKPAEEPGGAQPEVSEEAGPVFGPATAPMPEDLLPDKEVSAEDGGETPPALVFDPAQFAELPPDEPAGDGEPERPRRKLRGGLTAVFALFALVVGLPVTLLMILIGVPVLLLGGGVIALVVYTAATIIAPLKMFSDIMLVGGTSLAICGLGLLIAWFGLWVSIELGALWINGVVLRLGRCMCFEKEEDVQ